MEMKLWRLTATFLCRLRLGFFLPEIGMRAPGSEESKLLLSGLPLAKNFSHVGAAGDGLVSLKMGPVSMPSVATPELKRFWRMERALPVILSTGSCRVYGFQADEDSEKLEISPSCFSNCIL